MGKTLIRKLISDKPVADELSGVKNESVQELFEEDACKSERTIDIEKLQEQITTLNYTKAILDRNYTWNGIDDSKYVRHDL